LAANNNKVKYFSLPDYTEEVMAGKALLADFKAIKKVSEKIADLLTAASRIRITTAAGTDIEMDVCSRKANPAPGYCYGDILLASPPDAETNIAPNELLTNGIAVIDGSIPCEEIGLLTSPVKLEIRDGLVVGITGEESEMLNHLFDKQNNPKCRIVAEFGIGLNKLAELTGSMLEDEGALGTVHLGIGSNKTIGGLNDVPFHLDHVIRNATVLVDGYAIMRNGVLSDEFEWT
jgi:leucyl aminopeptidase (aminopeptidase T)